MDEIELTLKERKHESGPIYSLVFSPAEPVHFKAGQYAHFRLPDLSRSDLPVRELSFASAPEDSEIMITVNTRSGSAYQKGLLALLPGEKLMLFKIKGEMTAPEGAGEKAVCISHGVGAAPFRSILRHLAHHGREADVTLIQIDRDEHLYYEEFNSTHARYYHIGRSDISKTLEMAVAENPHAQYLIAGAPTFVLDIEKHLRDAGIGSERVKRDVFNGLEE